ncbi:hypothetical protein YWIDRAFT_02253 [Streptomyces sp. SceaMP-e96]|nr:hypothetical protein YWIDRAFT_02253 [Streptomyces sp. SceaMP-e96]
MTTWGRLPADGEAALVSGHVPAAPFHRAVTEGDTNGSPNPSAVRRFARCPGAGR